MSVKGFRFHIYVVFLIFDESVLIFLFSLEYKLE